jgi:Asp-tRNA(Asn)/Glu-tRNA(Gln) amidotransferase A subunit family amidase
MGSSPEPWRLTATEAVSQMRSGTLTVTNYVESLLARVSSRDDAVHAWAHLSPSHARSEAARLDALPASQRGPLHGLPIGVKDVILTKDLPTQHNSRLYQTDKPGGVDAGCIITLRASGALVFGKTTTTEFAANSCGGWHQNLTSNAHAKDRTPGGSSSGSGASVGDAQVPTALGTQTGGSVIRPGSFNGVYAIKPTWGAVSREGLDQYSVTCDTLGWYGRSAGDLELLADVFRLRDDEKVQEWEGFNGKTAAFLKTHAWKEKAGPGLEKAWEKAKGLVEKEGASVEEIDLPEEFAKFVEWHEIVLAGEGRASFLGNYLLAKEEGLMDELMMGHVEETRGFTRKQQLEAYDGAARLRPVWDEIAAKYDVVITPSVPDEAPLDITHTGDAVSQISNEGWDGG